MDVVFGPDAGPDCLGCPQKPESNPVSDAEQLLYNSLAQKLRPGGILVPCLLLAVFGPGPDPDGPMCPETSESNPFYPAEQLLFQ